MQHRVRGRRSGTPRKSVGARVLSAAVAASAITTTSSWLSPSLFAAAKTWTNSDATESWSAAANWSPAAVPTSSDDILLPAGFPNADASQPVILPNGAIAKSLQLDDSYTLRSGTLFLSSVGSGITVAAGKTATLSTTFSGNSGLTKAGAGTLILNHTGSTFTGGVKLNGGVLQISADSRLGNVNNGIIFGGGGTLATTGSINLPATRTMSLTGAGGGGFDTAASTTLDVAGNIIGTGPLTKSGAGTLRFSGVTNLQSTFAVNAGTVEANSTNALTGDTATVTLAPATTLSFLKSVDTGIAVTCDSASLSVAPSAYATFHTGLGAGSGSLTKIGDGYLSLRAPSTRTGATTINAGELRIDHPAALGTGTSPVVINAGGKLSIGNSFSGNVTLKSGGKFEGGTYTGVLTVQGAIGGSNVTIGDWNLSYTIFAPGANLVGASTTTTINVNGGTLVMTSPVSYAGMWWVNGAGVLDVPTTADCLGTGNSTVYVGIHNDGGTLQIGGTFARPIYLGGGSLLRASTPDARTTQPLYASTLYYGSVGTVSETDVLTLGPIVGGNGSTLIVVGPGKVVLTQPPTGSCGFGIAGGTLEIPDDSYLGGTYGYVELGGGTLATTTSFQTNLTFLVSSGYLPTIGGTFRPSPGTTLTMNGSLEGTLNNYPGIYVRGGTVQMNGASPNLYYTNVDVQGATLRLNNNSALGDAANFNSVSASQGGILELMDSISFPGNVTLGDGGRVRVATGAVASIAGATGGTSAGDGYLDAGVASFSTLTVGPVNASAGGSASFNLHVAGAGTVALTAPGTYDGSWVLDSGTLQLAAADRLGNSTTPLTFNGGTLKAGGNITAATRDVSVNAAGGSVYSNGFTVALGSIDGAGAFTKNGPGFLTARHVRTTSLTISQGTLAINATGGGSPAGVSAVDTLFISPGAKLDLGDNKLIVRSTPIGSWNGSTYTGIAGLVRSGRNGGTWNGSGIVTSQTDATSSTLTGIGVARAAEAKAIAPTETALWGGQTVRGSDSLVMYTYGGDANLDGKINVDDYGHIDSSVVLAGVSGWFNGDFNYDGKINVDDYGIIDFNVAIQGAPFPGSAGGPASVSLSVVPEPQFVGTLFAAASFLSCKRGRKRIRLSEAAAT